MYIPCVFLVVIPCVDAERGVVDVVVDVVVIVVVFVGRGRMEAKW